MYYVAQYSFCVPKNFLPRGGVWYSSNTMKIKKAALIVLSVALLLGATLGLMYLIFKEYRRERVLVSPIAFDPPTNTEQLRYRCYNLAATDPIFGGMLRQPISESTMSGEVVEVATEAGEVIEPEVATETFLPAEPAQ